MTKFFCAVYEGDCIAWQDNQAAPDTTGAVGLLEWDGETDAVLLSGSLPVDLIIPAGWSIKEV